MHCSLSFETHVTSSNSKPYFAAITGRKRLNCGDRNCFKNQNLTGFLVERTVVYIMMERKRSYLFNHVKRTEKKSAKTLTNDQKRC